MIRLAKSSGGLRELSRREFLIARAPTQMKLSSFWRGTEEAADRACVIVDIGRMGSDDGYGCPGSCV